MNPTSLYITTSRLVFHGDIEAGLQDLNRLLPYLRKSLSCAVCCKLLVEPHSPFTTDCQHHICRVCVGKHKKIKPSCRFCKGLLQYRENTHLRLLLQCYKSICVFIRTRPIYADICKCATAQTGNSTDDNPELSKGKSRTMPNSLMDLIEEGAAFEDEFKCLSGLSKSAYSILPCIFPPPIVNVESVPAKDSFASSPPAQPCCSKSTNNVVHQSSTVLLTNNVKSDSGQEQSYQQTLQDVLKQEHNIQGQFKKIRANHEKEQQKSQGEEQHSTIQLQHQTKKNQIIQRQRKQLVTLKQTKEQFRSPGENKPKKIPLLSKQQQQKQLEAISERQKTQKVDIIPKEKCCEAQLQKQNLLNDKEQGQKRIKQEHQQLKTNQFNQGRQLQKQHYACEQPMEEEQHMQQPQQQLIITKQQKQLQKMKQQEKTKQKRTEEEQQHPKQQHQPQEQQDQPEQPQNIQHKQQREQCQQEHQKQTLKEQMQQKQKQQSQPNCQLQQAQPKPQYQLHNQFQQQLERHKQQFPKKNQQRKPQQTQQQQIKHHNLQHQKQQIQHKHQQLVQHQGQQHQQQQISQRCFQQNQILKQPQLLYQQLQQEKQEQQYPLQLQQQKQQPVKTKHSQYEYLHPCLHSEHSIEQPEQQCKQQKLSKHVHQPQQKLGEGYEKIKIQQAEQYNNQLKLPLNTLELQLPYSDQLTQENRLTSQSPKKIQLQQSQNTIHILNHQQPSQPSKTQLETSAQLSITSQQMVQTQKFPITPSQSKQTLLQEKITATQHSFNKQETAITQNIESFMPSLQQTIFQLPHGQFNVLRQNSAVLPSTKMLQKPIHIQKQQGVIEQQNELHQITVNLQQQQHKQKIQGTHNSQLFLPASKLQTQQLIQHQLQKQTQTSQQSNNLQQIRTLCVPSPRNMLDVVIRPNTCNINSNVIKNVLPTRLGYPLVHSDSVLNRSSVANNINKSTVVTPIVETPSLSKPIIKNSCVPTTPRIVNITTPQEIVFEAAPIKTVSSGSTMYSVLYAESGKKFTIKRKPDPVSTAKPAKIATIIPNVTVKASLSKDVTVTTSMEIDNKRPDTVFAQEPKEQSQLNNSIVLQFGPPNTKTLKLPHQQQHSAAAQTQTSLVQQQQVQLPLYQQSQLKVVSQQNVLRTQHQLHNYQTQQIQLNKLSQNTTSPQHMVTLQQPQNVRPLIVSLQSQSTTSSQQQQLETPIAVPQQSLKRKGCRCGNATPTPGKLTCCGQRCPCYVDSKSCVDCKCRGCRNPHRADGLKIRRSLTELLQQYNAPATTSNVVEMIPSMRNALTLGPTITPVTYSMSAIKPNSLTTPVANSGPKGKVINARHHPTMQTTTISPINSIIKIDSGEQNRTATNCETNVGCVLSDGNVAVPTCGTITIRPTVNSILSNCTTNSTITYLPSSSSSTFSSATSVSHHSRMSRQIILTGSGSNNPTKKSLTTMSSASTYDKKFTPVFGSNSTTRNNKTLEDVTRATTPEVQNIDSTKTTDGSEIKNTSVVFTTRKPDALLSQSSVALMPIASSTVSFSTSDGVWSPSSPSNIFATTGTTVLGTSGTSSSSVAELSTLSGYDVNSFVNISNMLDPDGVIDLCEDLELSVDNLIPME